MHANFNVLSIDDPSGIEAHLRALAWIDGDERVVSISRAGEGNMNMVARVRTDRRSLILKQSRPWVEKYPSIQAPQDRILVEAAFYHTVSHASALAAGMPRFLALDSESRSALIEDLGGSSDCTDIYDGAVLDLSGLVAWLSALHRVQPEEADREVLRNREMRHLNHAHIFDLPMSGAHGMDLDEITPGLASAAREYSADTELAREVQRLGDAYLEDGPTLLHGDYYPGSWLRTAGGIRVIDPEFGFLGPAEFDLGVFKAHLELAGLAEPLIGEAVSQYSGQADSALVDQFAGVEIMRRLIGVAQLPLKRTIRQKVDLLKRSKELLLGGG
ncbi:MAG: 5-methylthioribose kinase [Thalassolituus oleivorans]|jgi:5-methylthioribose kinase